jgi:hypothetical protein
VYQIEVKRYLVEHRFSQNDGWHVTVDLDAMELGIGNQHPEGKRQIAERCKEQLRRQGVVLGTHPAYNRADVVAEHHDWGTIVFEVEGEASRQREQAMYSALGQTLLSMTRFENGIRYGVSVPDCTEWERQLKKIPNPVLERLDLCLLLVSADGVRPLNATTDYV